jgi:diguanylate cyclase (GGDEF)-like protein/PAS domain S-box-containing protein
MISFSRLAIRTKTALVMTLILAVMSIAVYLYFPRRMKEQALADITENAATLAELSAFSVAPALALPHADRIAVAQALVGIRRSSGVAYLVVVGADGEIVSALGELYALQAGYKTVPMQPLRQPGVRDSEKEHATLSGGYAPDGSVYQTVAEARHRGRVVGTVYVGVALRNLNNEISRSRATVALVTALAFAIGVAATFLLSTFITGPLSRIARTSEEIARGDLHKRAKVNSSDEVGQLARSFNLMVDRLAAAQLEMEGLNRTLEQRVDERTAQLREEFDERRRAETALLTSEERYRLLFERNLAGAYIATTDFKIVSCNAAFAGIFGYASTDDFLSEMGELSYMHTIDRDALARRLREEGAVMNEEVELRGRYGQSVWALENVRLIPGAEGREATLEGVLLDISERKRAEKEMEYRAYHDVLTGLPNRSLFLDRVTVALTRAQRLTGMAAVMFLDLDDLKTINDTLGHSLGDELLKRLAERLSDTLRAEDTVARVGGDEFMILLPEIRGEEGAVIVARKIQRALVEPFVTGEDEIHVTVSTGIAIYPIDGGDPETLIRAADAAMYRVKEKGGADHAFASRTGDTGAVGRTSMEQEIREGIERDEFVLYFQPQVDLHDGRLSGTEALVRWNHPSRSLIAPAGFIPIAESTGLITALGERVLYKACEQAVAWRNAGHEPPMVSVNVSARQFYQRDFIGMVKRVLMETRVDASWVELEITETVTMQKGDHAQRMLRRLRDLGLSIAIDDFGTGQSSLSYLKSFPLDTVKIDKSFVHDIGRRATSESIIAAVLLLGTQLSLRTIAEGVENVEQRDFLRRHHCRAMQGFLISKPVPAEEFEDRFLRQPVHSSVLS